METDGERKMKDGGIQDITPDLASGKVTQIVKAVDMRSLEPDAGLPLCPAIISSLFSLLGKNSQNKQQELSSRHNRLKIQF